MMRLRTCLAAAAMLLAGCQSEPAPQPAQTGETDEPADALAIARDTALCTAVAGASESGNESMRAAFVSTTYGRDYGGGVIAELVKQKGYAFLGTEMVGGTCYGYAQAKGIQWGKAFDLAWRCPVKLLGDSPSVSGKYEVEVVDDKQCDFDAGRGDPIRQEVSVEMFHL